MTPTSEIRDIFNKYPGTDKSTLHSYETVYPDLLGPYRGKPVSILEVGARDGSSLRAWREYFGPQVRILGLDNGHEGWMIESCADWSVEYADQFKPETVKKAVLKYTPFDIIIDDGCHNPYCNLMTWAMLWPYVTKGGIYILEDIEGITYAEAFKSLVGGDIIDLRKNKGRHDDIMMVWRK
jgi:hypothetical protein